MSSSSENRRKLHPDRQGRRQSLPKKQNTVVAARHSSRISARAECNRNFGKGSGSGGEVMGGSAIIVAMRLTATVRSAKI